MLGSALRPDGTAAGPPRRWLRRSEAAGAAPAPWAHQAQPGNSHPSASLLPTPIKAGSRRRAPSTSTRAWRPVRAVASVTKEPISGTVDGLCCQTIGTIPQKSARWPQIRIAQPLHRSECAQFLCGCCCCLLAAREARVIGRKVERQTGPRSATVCAAAASASAATPSCSTSARALTPATIEFPSTSATSSQKPLKPDRCWPTKSGRTAPAPR